MDGCSLRRRFISDHSTVDSAPLTLADYAQCDSCKMSYDVFHCRRTNCAFVTAAQLRNLDRELTHMTVAHRGASQCLRYEIVRFWNLCIVHTSIPPTISDAAMLLDLRFPSFRAPVRILLDNRPENSSPENPTLLIMQRNNEDLGFRRQAVRARIWLPDCAAESV